MTHSFDLTQSGVQRQVAHPGYPETQDHVFHHVDGADGLRQKAIALDDVDAGDRDVLREAIDCLEGVEIAFPGGGKSYEPVLKRVDPDALGRAVSELAPNRIDGTIGPETLSGFHESWDFMTAAWRRVAGPIVDRPGPHVRWRTLEKDGPSVVVGDPSVVVGERSPIFVDEVDKVVADHRVERAAINRIKTTPLAPLGYRDGELWSKLFLGGRHGVVPHVFQWADNELQCDEDQAYLQRAELSRLTVDLNGSFVA